MSDEGKIIIGPAIVVDGSGSVHAIDDGDAVVVPGNYGPMGLDIHHNALMATINELSKRPVVAVDRSILVEALEQIEATWRHEFGRCTGGTCNRYQGLDEPESHTPKCRYVRVRDALRKAVGK